MANPSLNRPNGGAETAVLVSKMIFLSIGIASTAFFSVKFAVPYFSYLLSDSLPELWKSIAAGLVPRYLFIAVNSIIIVVWKLHGVQHHDDHEEDRKMYPTSSDSLLLPPKLAAGPDPSSVNDPSSLLPVDIPAESSDLSDAAISNEQSSDPWPPPDTAVENDSMDATWKAITAGGSSLKKNQSMLTKSDTWERTAAISPHLARSSPAIVRRFGKSDTFRESEKPKKEMRKSETFRETFSPGTAMGWRGRDRLVIGQDELFGKVEAFIKMNYEQMRRQHQESGHRYGMVNAAY